MDDVPAPLPVATTNGKSRDSSPALESSYEAIIGENNRAYYLRYFRAADQLNRPPASLNWPAFLVTVLWMTYRKMWLAAVITFVAPMSILLIFGALALNMESQTAGGGAIFAGLLIYGFIVYIVVPRQANAMYYRHARRLRKQASIKADEQGQIEYLRKRGGTSWLIALVAAIVYVPLYVLAVSLTMNLFK